MPLKIISADERLAAKPKINIALFGPAGIGKTYAARTLDPKTTLFLDLEAGTIALGDWGGDFVDIRKSSTEANAHPWELARGIACVLAGPDPSVPPDDRDHPYGAYLHDNIYVQGVGKKEDFAKYDTIFVDSITVASRLAFDWSQRQPDARTPQGKADTRGAYGLLGREMIEWLTTLQHISDKNVIVVGILDVQKDPDIPGRISYSPQIEGGKAPRELPGIFDEVITMGLMRVDGEQIFLDYEKGDKDRRAFICKSASGFGVPGKGRRGCVDPLEPPNLAALIEKISKGVRNDSSPAQPDPAQGAPDNPSENVTDPTPE